MLNPLEYGREVIGPIVYEYVLWVLEQAQQRNLKTLYFLSRDGYLLKQVAEALCERKGYLITCKYLYCSRMALRMPTYHFIGEEAYDLLLQGGYHITPYILMRRLNLDSTERGSVYEEIGVEREEKALTPKEYRELMQKLKKSKRYGEYIYCKSVKSYDTIIGYFRQEGLFGESQVAIVDSGWSGSMQRSMRQLLEREGYRGNMIGFYFGLYNAPTGKEDGEYEAYYFNAFCNLKNKVYFDNTLFECMLSAPHGMTIGYFKEGEHYYPIWKKDLNESLSGFVEKQIAGALEFAKRAGQNSGRFVWKESVKQTYKVLKRAVVFPTRDEVDAYCSFKFCDDVSEDCPVTFLRLDLLSGIKNHMLAPKIAAKIRHKDNAPINDIFWPYGMITYVKYPKRLWYRWNICLLQLLRHIRATMKEKRRILDYE